MIDQRRIDRMAGCACLGKAILIPVGIFAMGAMMFVLLVGGYTTCPTPIEPRLTRATAEGLEAGIRRFQEVHHRLPFSSSLLDGGRRVRTAGAWLEAVMRLPSVDGRESFITIHHGKAGLSGWVDTEDGMAVVDAWGEPLYVVSSDAPDLPEGSQSTAIDSGMTAPVSAHKPMAYVYSSGPDRDPGTWQDNIQSW